MELKIGSKIAELRKAKGMTQEQLALALGISAPAVSKWETDNSVSRHYVIMSFGKSFGHKCRYIVGI